MTRFYRFISSDELHTIFANSFTNDMIASEDAAMVHLFKEKTPTIIADHKHHKPTQPRMPPISIGGGIGEQRGENKRILFTLN